MPEQRHAVLITGGRDYDDEVAVDRIVQTFPRGTLVITGGADGTDLHADNAADRHGYPCASLPYFHWLGKYGGPERNTYMVAILCALRDAGWLVKVVAFPGGRGTANCVRQAKRAGLAVQHVG